MQIVVRRSGGLTGLEETIAELNTAEMLASGAQELERMIGDIGFFELPATIPGGAVGADFFHYEITVTETDRQHTVAFDDDNSPAIESLRNLVDVAVQING